MDVRRFASSLLILGSVIVLTGMGRIGPVDIDRSDDPKYSWIIGKQYVTKMDLLIYRETDTNDIFIAPFGYGGQIPERNQLKEKFPFRYYDIKVLEIFPEGSSFKITQVREQGPPSGTSIGYYGEVISSKNKEFEKKEISFWGLTEVNKDPPRFKAEFVEKASIKPGP